MTRLAVLLGDPVKHSRSPAMFAAAFAVTKVDATYLAWQVRVLQPVLDTLREIDALGANVTLPHKQAVMPLLDSLSPLAKRTGAVNCITQRNGKLHGDNTDVFGFAESLKLYTKPPKQRPALVLGAGGAARAVIVALQDLGFKDIHVCNRTPARRVALKKAFADVHTHAWSELPKLLTDAGLVVHATSAEVKHEPLELAFSAMRKDAVFADLTYGRTPLVRQAEKRKLLAFDGSDMLVLQAARAFTAWTKKPAPIASMRKAL